MCQHIYLTARDGRQMSYSLMDCESVNPYGEKKGCVLSSEALAHLMASGQFRKIQVQDETPGSSVQDFEEAAFPAFIEKTLGAGALSKRHHAPEAIGQEVR